MGTPKLFYHSWLLSGPTFYGTICDTDDEVIARKIALRNINGHLKDQNTDIHLVPGYKILSSILSRQTKGSINHKVYKLDENNSVDTMYYEIKGIKHMGFFEINKDPQA
jgi:hypothetical protein